MLWLFLLLIVVEGETMNKYISGNQKHLTLETPIYIENELNKGTFFKDITRFLCKDSSTLSIEAKAHRLSDWYHKSIFYNAKNFCIHHYHYRKTNAYGKIVFCGVKCFPFYIQSDLYEL